eukprot:SAG11_NODE_3642_length_2316_cov_25.110059_2_plen_177_part_00
MAAGRRLAAGRRCPAPSRTLPHGLRPRPLAGPPPFLCRRAAGRGRGAAALRSYLGLPRGEAWGWAAAEPPPRQSSQVRSTHCVFFGGGGGHRRLYVYHRGITYGRGYLLHRPEARCARPYVIPRCFVCHRGITYGRGYMLHRPEVLRTAVCDSSVFRRVRIPPRNHIRPRIYAAPP